MRALRLWVALMLVGACGQVAAAHAPEDRYDEIIARHSKRHRLDPRLVKAIIAVESSFCQRARSPKGARGLMQLMPDTAREMGVSPARLSEPEENIRAGTAYLATLLNAAARRYRLKGARWDQAPDWVRRRVIAAYNFGPRAFGPGRHPPETRRYVRDVMKLYG